jgi:purine-binding chemotaxis protein CheW
MIEFTHLVVFRVDAQRYAVALNAVERIVRAVEVTHLPNGPAILLGIIDVEGRIFPVLNLRKRLGLPEREITPADQFLIARTTARTVVIVVDETLEVIERMPIGVVGSAQIVPGLKQIEGVIQLEDGLALIHDLEKFLSLEEGHALDLAMNQDTTHGK